LTGSILTGAVITLGIVFGVFAIKINIINPLWYGYYLAKIWDRFPPLTWLTVDDAKKFGVPRKACERILPDMLMRKLLEVRPKPDLEDKALERAQRMRFNEFTIDLYEFRVIHGGPTRRRRRRFDLKEIFKHMPGLEAPPAPS